MERGVDLFRSNRKLKIASSTTLIGHGEKMNAPVDGLSPNKSNRTKTLFHYQTGYGDLRKHASHFYLDTVLQVKEQ